LLGQPEQALVRVVLCRILGAHDGR
jgi:hypothetical protein